MVEVQAQLFVDGLIHPVLGLFVAAIVEVAVILDEIDILVNHVPYLFDACAVETTVTEHLRHPATLRLGEKVQGVAEVGGGHVATVHVVAVALVDDNAVRDFHDATLDALQLVACASHLQQQKEIDHGVAGGLRLSDAYRLNEYLVEACSLAEDNRLTRLAGYTTQGTGCWTGADERVRMDGELLHACLVTQNRTLGALATGVNGQDGKATAMFLQHMDAKGVDARRFTGTRHTAYTYANAVATEGQALVDDLLSLGLVVGVDALHQRDSL